MRTSIYIYITSLFLLLNANSCDFLEVDPVGRTTIPVFFSDMDGIRAAMPGAYSSVYDYHSSELTLYGDITGNMIQFNTLNNHSMIKQYNFISEPDDDELAVGHIWTDGFEAMANVNNIIEYQPQLLSTYPKHKDELNKILGEALFLRALLHFDLCRVYGQPYNYTSDASHLGIPIVLRTPSANTNLARSSVNQVYKQIIQDLKLSIEKFGNYTSPDTYHASVEASEALLCRVYMYMEEWDEVIDYSSRLINKIPLSKGDNYLAMFHEMEQGDEAIFRLNGMEKRSSLAKFYNIISPDAMPADTLISLFTNTHDIRLQLLQRDEDGKTVNQCTKYFISLDVPELTKHYDPIVFRVSEMYLNRAEAYMHKKNYKGAAQDVKQIIARAFNQDVSEVKITETDEIILNRIIDVERAKELCFEGHQFYDITRKKQDLIREAKTNSIVQHMSYPNDRFVLPIPQKEIEANTNMQPNPTVNK